jgi:ABC-type transporter Mla maintaining outer membrane lipid asymmetry permease subunit MlaE
VPVLATILIAGRTGAALASDHGNRVYLHKTLAMRTLGAPVEPYLLTASLWMNLIGTVVLALVAYGAASGTSLVVFTWTQPDYTPFYWASNWGRKLQPWHLGVLGKGAGWVLGKLVCSGAGTAAIAYAFGVKPKRSAADVSKGITATVYWATVFVLVVHFIFALFEFDPPKAGELLFPGD